MKKKIIIGAIALMGVFGGLTAWQSLSGQNEVKAHGTDGNCALGSDNFCNGAGGTCYCLLGGVTVRPHKL